MLSLALLYTLSLYLSQDELLSLYWSDDNSEVGACYLFEVNFGYIVGFRLALHYRIEERVSPTPSQENQHIEVQMPHAIVLGVADRKQ